MMQNKNPYISKVIIKNFRNFLDVNVDLDHKQVIIGENNVGKTNFLRAIQLILDKNFSDSDRELTEEDFHDSIFEPMENGSEIEIKLQIKGYEHNRKLVAQFSDAVISDSPPTLQFTYKYFPNIDVDRNILNYQFLIFKGNDEKARFTSEDRSFININVIKALRDVERELKANKNSPLYKLVKQYEISTSHLEDISDDLKKAAEGIIQLDEIVHIKEALANQFSLLSGLQKDNDVTLRNFDIDTERLLYTLQVYMGLKERPVSELSLGLTNILYISLMLLLIKDKTILPIIKSELYDLLLKKDPTGLISQVYQLSENDNYIIQKDISSEAANTLYEFMDLNNYKHQSFTILAIEEPEAHLHPVLQRLIYREVLQNSSNSVIFTSHSPHIASVSPLKSIVHIRNIKDDDDIHSSKVYSTVNLIIDDKERKDVERYIDAKRGEIYFGKGIILVEGITEEYIIPAISILKNTPLDNFGVVVCNIDSTNFRPYVKLLNELNIPWVLFTDGDYYRIETSSDDKDKKTRVYHVMENGGECGYKGNEIVEKLLIGLDIIKSTDIPTDYSDQDAFFQTKGCFIGRYTFEVDMMEKADLIGLAIVQNIYNELKSGGKEMQENFEEALKKKDYWLALKKIENNISKGRFAQRLSGKISEQMTPTYMTAGIKSIIEKVKKTYE